MPAHGSRLPKSEATRLRLLDCAVAEIARSGPDRVGFTAVARLAGMSTGALYARYENADELLVDVWLQKCLPEVRRVVDDLTSAVTGESETGCLAVATRIGSLDPVLLATTRLLVAARRNDTLWEVVDPSFRETVDRAVGRHPGFPFVLAHVFGYVLGVAGSGLTHLDWVGPLTMAARAVPHAKESPVDLRTVAARPETPSDPMGDEVDNRLFDALSDVIGKVGVDRATVSRIARRAGVNPATMYMRYEDKDALVLRVLSIISEMGVSRNRELVDAFGESQSLDGGVAMFRGNATDEYQGIRRLRVETIMAAGCHDELRDAVRRTYVEAATADAAQVGVASVANDPRALAFALFMRFAFFGHALLREYGYLPADDPCVESVLDGMFREYAAAVSGYAARIAEKK